MVKMVSKDTRQTEAAIYARTSSPNQKNNYSIEGQINSCWKFCTERVWKVRFVFIDECLTGENIDRPKFQSMLENARQRNFNVIVFWKLDRFCRSLADLVNLQRMLTGWGIGLCSVTEFIDTTTPVGRFNFRSIANVAELEREIIGERARMGLYALARRHKWPNPHPPEGYDRDYEGKLVPNEIEVAIVLRIFMRYIQCKNMPQMAFELNKDGIRSKNGKRWSTSTVRAIITDEIYVGKYSVAGVRCYVKEYRILSDRIFATANEIRRRYENPGSVRPPMQEGRRQEVIKKMFCKFSEIVEGRRIAGNAKAC